MEQRDLEDVSAAAVHADELEGRGDSRAELVRAQLAGDAVRARELISTNWSAWLGAVSPGDTLLRWMNGFVVEASVRRAPANWRVGEILERPALRLIRRFAIGRDASLSSAGLDQARSLRQLLWFSNSPLADLKLVDLETLTVDLRGQEVAAIKTLQLPALRQLHTRCTSENEAGFMRTLADVSWWESLEMWTHRVRSLAGLFSLGTCPPLINRAGRGLVALCEATVYEQVTPELRQALPHAVFKLMPTPSRPVGPEDSHGPADVSVTPGNGRMDFRELRGWVRQAQPFHQGDGFSERGDGPGEAFKSGDTFSTCGWCGSDATREIHSSFTASYSRDEKSKCRNWEYECLACGLFTHMRSIHTR